VTADGTWFFGIDSILDNGELDIVDGSTSAGIRRSIGEHDRHATRRFRQDTRIASPESHQRHGDSRTDVVLGALKDEDLRGGMPGTTQG